MGDFMMLDAMRRAIVLSAYGLGATSPNPPVGCVILNDKGVIVGEGYHERKGEHHAEVHALAAAGIHARGGVALVTLEPCNHVGRTPACHQALIDAQVARVVIALVDPTSRGDGGAAQLRRAGIEVQVGLLADEARLVIGPWLAALEIRRPFTTWAHVVSEQATLTEITAAWSELRPQFDAVLDLAGNVEESVSGAHGTGMIEVTEVRPPYEPTQTLEALYTGGVRSLLLVGSPSLIEPFLHSQVVDKIEIRSTLPINFAFATVPSTTSWSYLPPGYRLTSVTRTANGVRAQAIRV